MGQGSGWLANSFRALSVIALALILGVGVIAIFRGSEDITKSATANGVLFWIGVASLAATMTAFALAVIAAQLDKVAAQVSNVLDSGPQYLAFVVAMTGSISAVALHAFDDSVTNALLLAVVTGTVAFVVGLLMRKHHVAAIWACVVELFALAILLVATHKLDTGDLRSLNFGQWLSVAASAVVVLAGPVTVAAVERRQQRRRDEP